MFYVAQETSVDDATFGRLTKLDTHTLTNIEARLTARSLGFGFYDFLKTNDSILSATISTLVSRSGFDSFSNSF